MRDNDNDIEATLQIQDKSDQPNIIQNEES